MGSDATLRSIGHILVGDDYERDAIHIAVAPVIALETLEPGQHVGVTPDGRARTLLTPTVGIVDPFLRQPVKADERFWLFLYPGSITALRHHWTHPAFDGDSKAASRAWIEAFAAAELDQTYSRLMEAADYWLDGEEYTYDNSERYKRVDKAKWPLFWHHYEIVTGRKVVDHEAVFFTCAC